MAFVRLIFTASKLKKLKRVLVEEKQDALKHKEQKPVKKRFRHIFIDCRLKILKCFSLPPNSCLHRLCYRLRHDGSFENYLVKSVLGFLGGFLLTYIFFMFFVVNLNFKLSTATIICSILGSILTIGLAFSYKVRCIVLLTLPQFFSKKGRQALLAYAFILAISGPAKNTLNNMAILSESLACGQEQLKSAVRQIIEVIKKPFYAIKEAIKKIIKTVKEIVKKIKEVLMKIKRVIMAIIRVIKACFEFLGKILNICNKELGTPFERCSRIFENAVTDCNAKLGPLFNWLCSLTYIVKSVCYIVKIFDFVCIIIDFISNSIIGVVIRKVKSFIRHIKTMFYVRIKFSHSFKFESTASKSISEISAGIVTEIKERSRIIIMIFDFMTSAATVFFIFIVVKVVYYRYKFLTSERFDNRYITTNFIAIDLRRAKIGRETILPLNAKELNKYIAVGSTKLIDIEKKQLKKAFATLGIATLKLATHMAADYSLYWILNLIRYYARFQSKVKAPNVPMVYVTGEGFLAALLKSIVKAFQPLGMELEIDTIPCLPTPIPPDYDRYIQIASLVLICWLLAIVEPYGLRLRNKIMCYYHPHRARERAIWLYNNILRSRNSFLKFARRQLRRKVFGSDKITKITFKEYLKANSSKCLRLCLGPDKQTACLLCGEVFRESDDKKPIRCQTPGCSGVYCEQCFNELQNLCTVCLSPIDYGDYSDVDEEKDSSDEDQRKLSKEDIKLKEKSKLDLIKKRNESDDDESGPKITKTSDYYTSEESSGEDYTYQYEEKSPDDPITLPPEIYQFKDVEKQAIPDYASMESFKLLEEDIAVLFPPNPLFQDTSGSNLIESNETSFVDLPSKTSDDEQSNKEIIPMIKIRSLSSIDEEILPMIKIRSLSSIDVDSLDEDAVPLITSTPYKAKADKTPRIKRTKVRISEDRKPLLLDSSTSDEEDLPVEVDKKKSSSPSFSSIDSEIKSMSPATTDEARNQRAAERFRHVQIETISETSRSSSGSSVKMSQTTDTLLSKNTKLRKRCVDYMKFQPGRKPGSSRCGSSSRSEINKIHKEKVRKYYKCGSSYPSKGSCKSRPERRKSKFFSFVQNIFPNVSCLRKSESTHGKSKEVIELRSFNYSQANWETLTSETSSPGVHFSSSQPESTPDTSNSSEENRRIRGGECGGDFDSIAVTSNIPTNLLEKYFLDETDFIPTRDCDLLMTSSESEYIKHTRYQTEKPVKDKGSKKSHETAHHLSNYESSVTGSSIPTSGTSSSTLSEDLLINLLGFKCKDKKNKTRKPKASAPAESKDSDSFVFVEHDQANPTERKRISFDSDDRKTEIQTGSVDYQSTDQDQATRDKATCTADTCSRLHYIRSKKLQATEEKIDYFDKVANRCNCKPKKSVCISLKSARPSRICCSRKDLRRMQERRYCDCCPEKDTGAYETPPAPPFYTNYGDCTRCFTRANNMQYCQKPNDNINKNFTEGCCDTSYKSVGTQTQYVKCPCNCGDNNKCIQKPPMELYPPCECSSDVSDEFYYEENPFSDLPYQNNDEYLELVQELEDTLVNRNRNRVRRAMEEFENRSRLNRPLEKPIINYHEPSESEEPILQKLTVMRSGFQNKSCGENCNCRRNRMCDDMRNYQCAPEPCEKPWSQPTYIQQVPKRAEVVTPMFRQRRNTRTHWQMNPRTGEWFKMNDTCPYRSRGLRSRTPSPTKEPSEFFDTEYYRFRCNNIQN